ncbi:MAG: AAA family ATPase [Pseudanabaena sp.]|jgi:predicted ATP-binding protein involved in virulence
MKIKNLHIQNLRGIRDLSIDIDGASPIVFLGENGSGKTTILKGIARFAANLFLDFTGRTKSSKSYEILSRHFKLRPNIDISYGCEQASTSIEFDFSSVKFQNLRITSSYKVNSDKPYLLPTNSKEIKNKRDSYEKWILSTLKEDSHASLPICAYYSVSRSIESVLLDSTEVLEDDSTEVLEEDQNESNYILYPQLLIYKEELVSRQNFPRFFKWFKVREDLENEHRLNRNNEYRDRQLQSVREAITSIIPEFTNLRIKRSPLDMVVLKNNQELSFDSLSDGEKCFLAMVGDIARRLAIANPDINKNPLNGYGLILIDEIELHLHPEWQRRVIPSLVKTFPNCQFIFTTHSPQVLGEVQGRVYRLRRTDEGIVAELRHTYGKDSNRILEEDMDTVERDRDIQEDILQLFRYIDDNDLESARSLKQSLKGKIGEDPNFVKADVLMRRKEVLGR